MATPVLTVEPRQKIKVQYYPTFDCDYIKTDEVTPQKLERLMDQPKNSEFFLVLEDDFISDFTIEFISYGRSKKAIITFGEE